MLGIEVMISGAGVVLKCRPSGSMCYTLVGIPAAVLKRWWSVCRFLTSGTTNSYEISWGRLFSCTFLLSYNNLLIIRGWKPFKREIMKKKQVPPRLLELILIHSNIWVWFPWEMKHAIVHVNLFVHVLFLPTISTTFKRVKGWKETLHLYVS